MRERIEQVLDTIRPALARDGGNIEFVDMDASSGVVRVRMLGACQGCPMGMITLKAVVEAALQDAIPEIQEVVAVPYDEQSA